MRFVIFMTSQHWFQYVQEFVDGNFLLKKIHTNTFKCIMSIFSFGAQVWKNDKWHSICVLWKFILYATRDNHFSFVNARRFKENQRFSNSMKNVMLVIMAVHLIKIALSELRFCFRLKSTTILLAFIMTNRF
jgi:hypothetical protein